MTTKLILNIQRLRNKLKKEDNSEQRVRSELKYKIHNKELRLKKLLN